jgi:hypothetical protein
MRRASILGLTGLLVLSLSLPAGADHAVFTRTDTVTVGNPASAEVGGVTEIVAPCDPAAPENGLDGIWYDIQGFEAHTATLTMGANADFDGWFYDASCTYIVDSSLAHGFFGTTETAPVPAGAAYIIVDLYAGANETFTLTIG